MFKKLHEEDEISEASRAEGPKTEVEVAEYRALVDLAYGDKRVSAGETVSDIPVKSLGWLLEGNYIEKVN